MGRCRKKLASAQKGKELKPAQLNELSSLRIKLTEELQSIYLNTNRLIPQCPNARAQQVDGRTRHREMQLATSHGVSRSDFISNWYAVKRKQGGPN